MKSKIVTFLIAATVMASAETYQQRLADSTVVLREMSHASKRRSDRGDTRHITQRRRPVPPEPSGQRLALLTRRRSRTPGQL
jgi:hypothetical protein